MTYIIDKHHNLWKKMNMKMAIQSPIRIKTLSIIPPHNQKMKFNSIFPLKFLIKQIARVPQLQDYSFPYQFTIFSRSSDKASLLQTYTYRLLSHHLSGHIMNINVATHEESLILFLTWHPHISHDLYFAIGIHINIASPSLTTPATFTPNPNPVPQ